MSTTLDLRRRYRTVVLDASTFGVLTILDGLASNRQLTRMLRKPWQYVCSVPSDDPEVNILHTDGLPFVEEGVRLIIVLRRESAPDPWKPVFGGLLLITDDAVDQDIPRTELTAYDPRQWLYARPVYKDNLGNLPISTGFSYSATVGSSIAADLLARTIAQDGTCRIDAGVAHGGTSFWGGTIDTTATLDINFQQGQTVGEAWDDLEATGSMDIVLTPIYDPVNRPGYLAELSILTRAGSQRNNTIFSWDKFPRNIVNIERIKDGTQRANTVAFFTKDGTPATVETDSGSITKFGVWFASQTWPAQGSTAGVTALAQLQLLLRTNGKETVSLTPSAESGIEPITDYQEGDVVPVNASKRLRKPLSGLQRVWGMTLEPTDDGVETVTELVVSADGL